MQASLPRDAGCSPCSRRSTAACRCRRQRECTPARRRSRTPAAAATAAAAAAAATAEATAEAQQALLYDLHDRLVPYEQAWAWQKQRVAELCSADAQDRRDTVLLLQHPPVYTLGAGSSSKHIKFDLQRPPHPLFHTERGGEVTYHGPGQLVLYPILDLSRHTQDLHWYLRSLEEVAIRALAATSGLAGERLPGLTGVWVGGAKLCAIGVRARKWVTYHGLALNVTTELSPFSAITPCGIADRPVGSVRTALEAAGGGGESGGARQHAWQAQQHEQQAQQQAQQQLGHVVSDPLIVEYRYALLEAVEDVFGLQLQLASKQQLQQLLASGPPGAADAGAALAAVAAA